MNNNAENNSAPRYVAIVDDDIDTIDTLTAFLKPKGFHLDTFESPAKLLDFIENNKESALKWNVLLSDFNMPELNGIELTQKLKSPFPNLPIVLISTNKSAELAAEAVYQGAYDLLVKPLHFAQLLISIERACHFTRLQQDNEVLRETIKDTRPTTYGNMVGKSPAFLAALDLAKKAARSRANIFISGESGTGKELIAKYIHQESTNPKSPFIAINCSAIPENLLESELFGHAKGSFTGAVDKKVGLFEEAKDGTVFLDEIGDLSLPLQAKLLRVLQEKKIRRVGENMSRPIRCRLLSATHKNLKEMILNNTFREDLFFRLNVIPIQIPPLRERKEDIPVLAEMFLKRYAAENNSPCRSFTRDAMRYLLNHPWPGNVRELENSIERATVLSSSEALDYSDFSMSWFEPSQSHETKQNAAPRFSVFLRDNSLVPLDDVINQYIEFCVEFNHGAKDRTAKEIGIDRKTLYKRLRIKESHQESFV